MCQRCAWCLDGGMMQEYHDVEWGEPIHDDRKQFEHLMMEAFQCGLSWKLMMQKREIFRACLDGFDYEKIANYNEEDVQRILNTPGMLKNAGKVRAAITNARAYMQIIREYGSFDAFIWGYTGGKTLVYPAHQTAPVPSNALSDALAKEMKRRGFKYLGTVTLYSHMQASGMINDHEADCFRYKEILANHPCTIVEE